MNLLRPIEDQFVYIHPKPQTLNDEPMPQARPAAAAGGLSLQELVVSIADALSNPTYDAKNPDHITKVQKLMESYDTSLNEFKRFEFWDEEKNYTRNLIASDPNFSLMLLCWNPRKSSPIHAHAESNCWMRIVSGTCLETRYAWPKNEEEPLHQIAQTPLQAGSVAFISDDIGLHKVENAHENVGAISLHLYSPPFDSCKVFRDPSCGKGVISFSTFYSEYGSKVEYH